MERAWEGLGGVGNGTEEEDRERGSAPSCQARQCSSAPVKHVLRHSRHVVREFIRVKIFRLAKIPSTGFSQHEEKETGIANGGTLMKGRRTEIGMNWDEHIIMHELRIKIQKRSKKHVKDKEGDREIRGHERGG